MSTQLTAGNNPFSHYYTRQLAGLIRSVRGADNADKVAAAPPAASYVSLPSFQYNWARFPAMPPAGETRDLLKLPDETLTYYAEQYLLYVAPWEHLVGTLIPNFYQFISWHEHAAPAGRRQRGEENSGSEAASPDRSPEPDSHFVPAGVARDADDLSMTPGYTLFQSARLQARKMLELIH